MVQAWKMRAQSTSELGDEPPLLTADSRRGPPDKRDISIRWLVGTVLTGATAIVLMGGALFVALDGRYTLAHPPGVLVEGSSLGISAETTQRVEKSDKIRFAKEPPRDKEVVRVSTVTREGDRDMIRVKPYIRIKSNMSVRRNPTTPSIPEFNPIALYRDQPEEEPIEVVSDSIYTATVDGEVSMSVKSYPAHFVDLATDVSLTTAEAETIVRDAARFLVDGAVQVEAMAYVDPSKLSVNEDPLRKHTARVIPENKTQLTRASIGKAVLPPLRENLIKVGSGDTLAGVLKKAGLPLLDVERIGEIFSEDFNLDSIQEGDELTLWFDPRVDNRGVEPVMRLVLYRGDDHIATIGRTDRGQLVQAPARLRDVDPEQEDESLVAAASTGARLTTYQSIFQTAYDQGIPDDVIPDLVRIFSYDVDFNRTARPDDELRVFYGLSDESDINSADEILYASLTLDGERKNYYRFRTPDDGAVDYYDEDGRSAKKFLMRKPVVAGRFRSAFGMRRHPILGYRRMHKGVDWSAPRGTPILAAGDGVISHAKWVSGYGRQIEIRHVNGYRTSYSHQTRFARGIAAGARVRQGQVIGYIGSTGLSTGPHLHYEVLVNGRHVDPMRIKLPRGRILEGEVLEAFRQERQRVDSMLAREGEDPATLQLADAS